MSYNVIKYSLKMYGESNTAIEYSLVIKYSLKMYGENNTANEL